jgi:MHS family proline/betaine transporter-like MFS transporter
VSPPAGPPVDIEALRRRAIWSVIIGGFFELFDFSIFGFFAGAIGRNFFPVDDPVVSLLSSFATFGVGFIMRPVGGLVIGAYSDRYGRKSALVFTLLMMAAATGATGLIPPYSAIGIAAPALLVLCRLVQGFSTGGEWGGSAVFLVEFAPPGRRGFFGSWQQFGVALGSLAGSASGFLMSVTLAPASLDAWGWRVPFIVGLLIAPVGYFLRRRVGETPRFTAAEAADRLEMAPVRATFTTQLPNLLISAGVTVVWAVGGYSFLTFLPTFAASRLGIPLATALGINSAASAVRIALTPPMGALSDRIGRKPMVATTALGFLLLSYPLFAWLVAVPTAATLACVQFVAALLMAIFSGPGPALLCELFPLSVRTTGLSVGYNLVTAIFGGFAPFVGTWLARETGQKVAPSYYVIACAALSLAAIAYMRERAHISREW